MTCVDASDARTKGFMQQTASNRDLYYTISHHYYDCSLMILLTTDCGTPYVSVKEFALGSYLSVDKRIPCLIFYQKEGLTVKSCIQIRYDI